MSDRLRPLCVAWSIAIVASIAGCSSPNAVLLSVTGDQPAQQYDLYVREDASQQIVFHSGFNPVSLPTEAPRDITQDKLKIALQLSSGGKYTLLLVGVIGDVANGKPASGSTQMFWAGRVDVEGTVSVSAKLLTVPAGDDQDGDLWPDLIGWPQHVPEAGMVYSSHPDLLDCDDKIDNPSNSAGVVINLTAAQINPFAVEICGDGFDENCDGDGDEACVDNDHDHDFAGDDCDDNDPKRHHPTDIDPFPDPPNCCGYNLGKANTAQAYVDFLHDPGDPNCFASSCIHDMTLCPMQRCGDGIDESCRGGMTNDPANDTACVVDADCDGYPAMPQGSDCDDHNPNVHPGAPEICGNGVDDNCNGIIDDGCVPCDLDGDGYERVDAANGCPDANDKHPGMVDCNDYDSGVYPGMTSDPKFNEGGKEGGVGTIGMLAAALRGTCRHIYEDVGTMGTAKIASFAQTVGDADCNGTPYEGCPPPSCDADGDGWPNANAGCNPNNVAVDCNDSDPTIYPGAPDKCGNGKAENCVSDQPCNGMDKDGDGYIAQYDCDDTNAAVHPWAKESCNGVDDDCDGLVDEGNPDPSGVPLVTSGAVTSCTDSDIGECGKTKGSCVCSASTPTAYFDPNGKRTFCPGENPPGATKPPKCFGAGQPMPQSCNATSPKDDDCDGRVDAPDGKNLAMKGMPCGINVGQCKAGIIVACDMTKTNCFEAFGRTPPSTAWYVCSTDAICPQAEVCNGLDDDCDGSLAGSALPPIPGQPTNDERDHDGDKYLACGPCVPPLANGVLGCNDCNDVPALGNNIHPGAKELCNNVNDACDPNWMPNTVDGKDECPGTMFPNCCSSQTACRNLSNDTNNCTSCGTVCNPTYANACGPGGCECGTNAACSGANYCNGTSCSPCNINSHCGPSCVNCGAGAVCKTDGSGCTGCNTDADCDASHYCSSGACLARKGQGGTCSADDQCLGGGSTLFCTDGFCCTSSAASCNGCKMCNASGTCVNVPSGQDPHNICNANVATCTSANCDGSGGCTLPNGTVCVGQACANGQQTVSQCMSGSCVAQAPTACTPYICGANACLTSCTGDTQCATGYYCAGSTCQATKALGSPCTANDQCASGNCVDAVCCSTASCGACLNCGATGSCTVKVTNGDDTTPTTCTGTTTCDASGNCLLKNGQACSTGTQCASTFCVGGVCCGTACNAGLPSCSGNSEVANACTTGSCNSTPTACTTGYTCNTTTNMCATTCTCTTAPCLDANDCASGYYCDGATPTAACKQQLATGSACTTNAECQSGMCLGSMTCK